VASTIEGERKGRAIAVDYPSKAVPEFNPQKWASLYLCDVPTEKLNDPDVDVYGIRNRFRCAAAILARGMIAPLTHTTYSLIRATNPDIRIEKALIWGAIAVTTPPLGFMTGMFTLITSPINAAAQFLPGRPETQPWVERNLLKLVKRLGT
jgi:hypothetical protein